MDKKHFITLLHKNLDPSAAETEELSGMLAEYPFFQSALALRLKGLHQHQGFAYNSALKKTAAHTINRGVLFDYITSEDFQQHKTAAKIQKRESPEQTIIRDGDLGVNQQEAEQVLDPGLFLKKGEELEAEKSPLENEGISGDQNDTEKTPANFDRTKAHSFSDWLRLTKAKPIERKVDASAEKEEEKNPDRHEKIIDEFIANKPKIKPSAEQKKHPEMRTTHTNQSLMTETLARVYWDQKNYDRAIQSYKILILKNPEKSGFFADQIRAIEEIKEKK
jgi:hypothetical protein